MIFSIWIPFWYWFWGFMAGWVIGFMSTLRGMM